jgi:hypothetical protein
MTKEVRLSWLLVIASWVILVVALPAAADDLTSEQQRLLSEYRAELGDLAAWCQEQRLTEQAAATRSWLPPQSSRVRNVYLLPRQIGSLQAPDKASENIAKWHQSFAKLRTGQAEKLWELAKRALQSGHVSLATELANAAARENPDHEELRRLFGFQKHQDRWLTPYAVAQAEKGRVWHEKFGWLPQAHVPRYEKGERYTSDSRWVSAAQDAASRRDVKKGWRIETDHFSILTNHSLEAGVQLGRRLELLYDAWQQLFAGYRLTKTQLTDLFKKGPRADVSRKKHTVTYFRDEAGYREALRGEIPDNLTTSGVYLSTRKTAYFFHTEDPEDNTLFHEVTHQLFGESPRVVASVGQKADFWIIEGIACYMESLVEQGDYLTLGGPDAYRAQDARYYLFKNDYYVSLAELTRLGMNDLQRHPQIARVYAQSAALVDFLVHAENGRRRDGLTEYLSRVYQGRPAPLASILGAPLAEIDKQYRQFQQLMDRDLELLPRGQRVTYLALGGTRVTDAGLAHVKPLKNLEWIDLYKTQVTDAGLEQLQDLPSLKQIDLSGTRITDAGLKHVARLSELQKLMLGGTAVSSAGLEPIAELAKLTQLDLWNTEVGDTGLTHLKRLKNLRNLDLSGTKVTDEGLTQLAELRSLESLDLRGTRVTAAGAKRLQAALPRLKITR